MAAKMAIRIIKRGEAAAGGAKPEKAASGQGKSLEMAARQARAAVSNWVRERQQPRTDPRRAFEQLFRTA